MQNIDDLKSIDEFEFVGPKDKNGNVKKYKFKKTDTIVGFIDPQGIFIEDEEIGNHTILAQKIIRENFQSLYELYLQGTGKNKHPLDWLVCERGYVKVMRRPVKQYMGAGKLIFSYKEGRTSGKQDFVFGLARKFETDVAVEAVPELNPWENNKWER